MTPEEDAIIIREHARIRERLMSLLAMNREGHYYVRRDRVLELLQLTEADKPRISYTRD